RLLLYSRIGSGLSPQNAQFTSMTNSAGRLPKPARAPKPPAANTALSRSVRNLFQTGSVIAFPPSSTHRRSREIPGTSPGRNPGPQVPSRTLAPRFRAGDESNYSSDSDVAVDMVGLASEAGAVADDNRLQRLVEPAVVGMGGGETLARGLGPVAQPGEIDGQHAAVLDHHPAADHHAMDGVAVLAVDQLVDRVVAGKPVRVVEIEHHQIG